MSLQIFPTQEAPPTPGAVSNEQGFSLHAEVSCAARDPTLPLGRCSPETRKRPET